MPFSAEEIARYTGIADDDDDDKTEKVFVVDDADVRSACQVSFTIRPKMHLIGTASAGELCLLRHWGHAHSLRFL